MAVAVGLLFILIGLGIRDVQSGPLGRRLRSDRPARSV